MEFLKIVTKNKILTILHKILLITGTLTLLYLFIQLVEEYLKSKNTYSFRK